MTTVTTALNFSAQDVNIWTGGSSAWNPTYSVPVLTFGNNWSGAVNVAGANINYDIGYSDALNFNVTLPTPGAADISYGVTVNANIASLVKAGLQFCVDTSQWSMSSQSLHVDGINISGLGISLTNTFSAHAAINGNVGATDFSCPTIQWSGTSSILSGTLSHNITADFGLNGIYGSATLSPPGAITADTSSGQYSSASTLPSLQASGTSESPFASITADLDGLATLMGAPLLGTKITVAGGDLSVDVLDVDLVIGTRLAQSFTFTPTAVMVELTSSLGEHKVGKLGDIFFFSTPSSGEGNVTVDAKYWLAGNLVTETGTAVTGYVDVNALKFSASAFNGWVEVSEGPYVSNKDISWTSEAVYKASSTSSVSGFNDISARYTVAYSDTAVGISYAAPKVATAITINGSSGNDVLVGNALDNVINGGAGADHIYGGVGNDTLSGGAGIDAVDGGAGNDTAILGYTLAGQTLSLGSFTLDVGPSDDAPGAAIALGTVGSTPLSTTGWVGVMDSVDWYSFTLAEESTVDFHVSAASGDVRLGIEKPTYGLVAMTNACPEADGTMTLHLAAGTYRLGAYGMGQDSYGEDTSYTFDLTARAGIISDRDIDMGVVSGVKTVSGSLEGYVNDSDRITFTLTSASLVTIDLMGLAYDTEMFLSNYSYFAYANGASGGGQETISAYLTAGSYTLDIRRQSPLSGDTPYQLRVATVDAAAPVDHAGNYAGAALDLGSLSGSVAISETLGPQHDTADWYKFTLDNDSQVTASLTGLGRGVGFALQDQYGSNLTSVTTTAPSSPMTWQLSAGTYYVKLEDSIYVSRDMSYGLTLNATPHATGADAAGNSEGAARQLGTLSGTTTVSDHVGVADKLDYYSFTLSETSDLSFTFGGLTGKLTFYMYPAGGYGMVYRNVEAGSVVRGVTGPGTYYFRIEPEQKWVEEGITQDTDYSLTIQSVGTSVAADAGGSFWAPVSLGTLADHLTVTEAVGVLDETDRYRFVLDADAEVTVALSGWCGNGGIVQLLQGDTTLWQNGGATRSAWLKAGTYDVYVGANRLETPYTLDISKTGGNSLVVGGETLRDVETLVFADATRAVVSMRGSEASEIVTGTAGMDVLNGYGGDDFLLADTGDDTLIGGAGNDTLDGGGGTDAAVFSGNRALYTVSQDNVLAPLQIASVADGVDRVTGVERFVFADGTYTLGQMLSATGRTQTGGTGRDTLVGGFGDDTLIGGGGADRLEGGAGNDVYIVTGSGVALSEGIDGGTDSVQSDSTYGLERNFENLTLSGAAAVAGIGNKRDNVLVGNDVANILSGKRGNDTLFGGGGNDLLSGGDDNDTLIGGAGADTVLGGSGVDIFRYETAADGGDQIGDFHVGEDKLAFYSPNFGNLDAAMLSAGAFAVDAVASQALATFLYNSATHALSFDADGSGAGAAIVIATFNRNVTLSANDILMVNSGIG